ncbi:MAG TPA: HD domain-containing protein [Candidatus Limnocylindria bacterium]
MTSGQVVGSGVGFGDHPVWEGLTDTPRPRGWGSYQDPVMGHLSLPPLLRQAMDLHAVQRLRSIRQNSGLELVFPGATHTRFEHSVGVMWLAGQAHDTLAHKRNARLREGRQPEWPGLGVATKLAVMFAGLFHDVGHGPYSHTHEEYQKREPALGKRHEERSLTIIKSDQRDIKLFLFKVFAEIRDDDPQAALVLAANVAALAQAQEPSSGLEPWTFLGSIVKADVDVDRLDYLRRDAFHTGVPIGVEPGEMIAAFTLAQVSASEREYLYSNAEQPWKSGDPEPGGASRWTLKLEQHVAPAVERMLSTRDMAYRAMYYHRTNRAVQEMLILAMQRLTDRAPETGANTGTAPSDLDEMTDAELLGSIDQTDPLLHRLYTGLRERRLYEPIGCALRVAGWPEAALTELRELRRAGSIRLRQRMKAVTAAVGIEWVGRSPGRVITDVTDTPVVDQFAYRTRMFWSGDGQVVTFTDDRKSGDTPAPRQSARVGYSLLELLPHLRRRHGVEWESGTKRDLHLEYMREIQVVLFFVPPEFLEEIHGLIRDQEGEARARACDDAYKAKLEPILRGLWTEVQGANNFPAEVTTQPGGWDTSFEEAAEQLRKWLRSEAFPTEGSRRS